MFMTEVNLDKMRTEDALKDDMKDFVAQWVRFFSGVQKVMADNEQLRQRVAQQDEKIEKLEEALEQQKKSDEWASRVTCEGVVEQIAACEDAKERDEARKLIEPLLKRAQVTQFRRDIKKRVKELNEENGGGTFNNYGTYTEVHAGGVNINNKKDAGH